MTPKESEVCMRLLFLDLCGCVDRWGGEGVGLAGGGGVDNHPECMQRPTKNIHKLTNIFWNHPKSGLGVLRVSCFVMDFVTEGYHQNLLKSIRGTKGYCTCLLGCVPLTQRPAFDRFEMGMTCIAYILGIFLIFFSLKLIVFLEAILGCRVCLSIAHTRIYKNIWICHCAHQMGLISCVCGWEGSGPQLECPGGGGGRIWDRLVGWICFQVFFGGLQVRCPAHPD